ncbi:MAG: tyrosine-type recombinase/integrase [Ardenticatenia bacterium]|nr:tyrosine-type recombinase/integrase [Ardenticatenia bacterium]
MHSGHDRSRASGMPMDLQPARTWTFLFTDIEGSTRLWERDRAAMQHALERHDRLLRQAIEAHRGRVFKTVGDAFCAMFDDARSALADYLEKERLGDAGAVGALLVSARGLGARSEDGRLSVRAINRILEHVGRMHDGEVADPSRRVSPLRPHDLRHTFAFQLARTTGADASELERRLGHRSGRYISRYTNPPEVVAAGYVEEM